MNRRLAIAASVVFFHLAALWALQSGLLRRAVEIIVPAQVLSDLVEPPPLPQEPPRPLPQHKPMPRSQPAPAPLPQPAVTQQSVPLAPPVAAAIAPAAPAPAVSPAPPAPAAPPARVDLPSSDAAYLNNPKPPYPALSKRLGEQGKVVVRVLIGADGTAQKAEIHTSSGFERLDQTALGTVLKWRYVPGKRGGVPEAMWFNVPINFVLE